MAIVNPRPVPVAFVVLKPGAARVTVEELRKFLGERLAAYKVPERIEFLGELPLSAVGKVDRNALRERMAAAPAAVPAAPGLPSTRST